MPRKPSPEIAAAWTRLLRVRHRLRDAVERDLKRAGFPPLPWYDALHELARAPHGAMRPVDLEPLIAMPQYGLSRLIDRLVEAGLVERAQCPKDRRGLFVVITENGRDLRKRMKAAYARAVEHHLGSRLSDAEAARLANLLERVDEAIDESVDAR